MRYGLAALALAAIGALIYVAFVRTPPLNPRFEPLQDDRSVPVLSSRGLDAGPVQVEGEVPGWTANAPCVDHVMIVVHGFNNSRDKAINRFGVARQSLAKNGFTGVVVGFSWDADTQYDAFSATGYRAGKRSAERTGPLLAQAIDQLKTNCPLMKVSVMGYSMGARVALEALLSLKSKVDTVHLVGAATDNEEVEVGKRYGRAMEKSAARVFNYYSPADSKLGLFFWAKEGDRALGKADIEHEERGPANFFSHDVSSELPSIREDGTVDSTGKPGENHSGYLGTRDSQGNLTDDGVMNLVAADAIR